VKYLSRYKLESNLYINQVVCPISILHGTEDRVVPFSSGKKLYDTVSKEKTTFVEIENGNHNNLFQYDAYHKLIDSLLK